MANKKYKLTDGNYWATDGIHDFGQNKTQREINAALVQADSDLSGAINHVIFAVPGTLKSNITSSGNIFTQAATDSRITSSSNVAGVTFDDESKVTSSSITVTPGTGTVTITGTTASFSGTINVIVELYN